MREPAYAASVPANTQITTVKNVTTALLTISVGRFDCVQIAT